MLDITQIPFEDRSKARFLHSGLDNIDLLLGGRSSGFRKGELTVWTGFNGSGKSTFVSQLALETVAQGFTVDMYSGELDAGTVKAWLYLQAAGQDGVMNVDGSDFWTVNYDMRKAIDHAL